ncbi:MAG TPA: sigma-70 family RNA polymerase sigma factor [Flavobacteriales bacterium]|nr:sigma-70 family RNA polymerase sigma factor [Flavobacteriales bacterium]HPH82015.1 sigma-70 family RNA polymerase sigma factor [Flavobacteriales bacterium]
MEEFSDRELLDLFAQASTRNHAFNMLVRQYQQRLYWHIRKMVLDHDDADDLLQNVFIKAFKALDNFREDSKIYTWLYKIATNECITFLNTKKKRFMVPMADVEYQLSQNLETDSYFSGDRIQMKLQQAILTLPDKQRLVFNLKYFEEMKYEDMSEILGTSVGALKASFHHAVKKIEEFMKRD